MTSPLWAGSRRVRGLGLVAFVLLAGTACADSVGPEAAGGPGVQLSVSGPAGVSQAELDALGAAFDRVDEYEVTIHDAGTLTLLVETTIPINSSTGQHVLDISIPESALGRTVVITLVAYDAGLELYRSTRQTTLGEEAGVLSLNLVIRYTGPGIRGTVTDVNGLGVAGVSVSLAQGQSIVDAVRTEDDGTYLFLDVDPASYQVVPTPPTALPNLCPGVRSVFLTDPSDVVVADFLASTDACDVRVLVVSGGDFDDTPTVQALLGNDPTLTVDSFFFINQLPGVDFLNEHDVVLLFMNGLFDESSALGDEVAEYVAAGGNLVLASFYWQGRSDSGLGSVGWGGTEAIDPFLSAGGATYQADTLGVVSPHPLTSGVTDLLSATGHRGGVVAKSGTAVVATWSDTTPFIGYRILPGGQRIVGVTLFPAAGQGVSGDVQALWENAVGWAGAAGGPAPAPSR